MKNEQLENSCCGTVDSPPQKQGDSFAQRGEQMGAGVAQSAQSAKEMAQNAAHSAKRKGVEAARQLQEQGQKIADGRKNQLGTKIKHGGEALRRAADKLRDEEDPNIAGYAEMIAERIERAGEYVQSRDFGAIYRDVEAAARRRPELLFGSMFVAGLAISRFLKASSHSSQEETRSIYRESSQEASSWSAPVHSEPPSGSMGDVPTGAANVEHNAPAGAII